MEKASKAMHKILVLGAGLVARPLLRYLLTHHHFSVYVATDDVERARSVMGEHPRGRVGYLDVRETTALAKLVEESDIVVSLLPAEFNVAAARAAIAGRKPFVTTSYASPGSGRSTRRPGPQACCC